MKRRVSRRLYNIYGFDIESHNDVESIAARKTSMWLGCLIDEKMTVDDPNSFVYTMEEFFSRLEVLANPKSSRKEKPCRNLCIYVWNLSFEWSFMLPVLLRLGYTYKDEIDWKNDERVFNTVSTRSCSSVWNISLKLNKKAGRIIFRDLSKIYPGSLRNVAKAFNLPTQKGEIDYRLNRLHGHVVTDEEKQYCFNDVKIIMDILERVADDKTFWSASSAATYSVKTALKFCFPRSIKPFSEFRRIYPELDKKETDFLRDSVSGGITYAPQMWQFKDINQKIIHIDLHQAHPSSLALNPMPCGKGEYFKGEPKNLWGINCCHIMVSYTAVKLHCIIQLIGIPFIDDRELTVWDFEIPLMKECYIGLEIKYIDGYHYAWRKSPFARYMRVNYSKRLEAKRAGDAYNTLRYKLLNNSFYGKLLEKPHNQRYENTVFADGVIGSIIHHKTPDQEEISGRYAYIPLGSCIPAYTRRTLVGTALKFGWKNILYFDTDSIFMLDNEETRAVLQTINLKDELGGWGIEDRPERAQFTAPKRYKIVVDGKLIVRAGGINFEDFLQVRNKTIHGENVQEYEDLADVPFDEINIVSSSWEVKRAFRCEGGTIIDLQKKEMKIPEKYLSIYEDNIK